MGNKSSTKRSVLEILRNNTKPVSGEEIANKIGLSRVSVWKAVNALENAGYKIDSTKNGYILSKDIKDSLFPWELACDENFSVHFKETTSTMEEAKKNRRITNKFFIQRHKNRYSRQSDTSAWEKQYSLEHDKRFSGIHNDYKKSDSCKRKSQAYYGSPNRMGKCP